MIFDHKNFVRDLKSFSIKGFLAVLISPFKRMKARIVEDDNVTEIADNTEKCEKEIDYEESLK